MRIKDEYENQGYLILTKVIYGEQISSLRRAVSVFEKEVNHYGIRDLMNKLPCIRQLAFSDPILSIAKEILGREAKPVRAVFFDKLPSANWNVAWHQDTTIVVNSKIESAGFSSWREKQGAMYVEPPEEYLSNMMALRIHLDSANTETGVLRVIPETHKDGRVGSKNILDIVEKSEVEECTANQGDVLLMNPLLFHSSRKATNPSHRRVIHIEYSAMSLPKPLEWFECA